MAFVSCKTCRYFEKYVGPLVSETNIKGLCRKNAPSPVHIAREAIWPEVSTHDWCGEYEKDE